MSRRRWVRWLLIVGAVLVGLAAVVALLAPPLIESRLEARLSEAVDAPVEVNGVEIRWRHLTVEVHGVHVRAPDRMEIDIERVDATLRWGELLRARVSPRIVAVRPEVTIWAGAGELLPNREREGIDGFERIEVVDGSVRLVLPTEPEVTELRFTELRGHLGFWEPTTPTAEMDLDVELWAAVGPGWVEVRGWLSSLTPAERWKLSFAVRQLDLVPLNPLWRDVLEMDLERGFFSLEGELERTAEVLRGQVRPHFDGMTMLGPDEGATHPMGEVLFGQMLMGTSSTIDVRRPVGQGGGASLTGLLRENWRSIVEGVIRRGYARRLSQFEGFTAKIDDVRVNFREGLLQMFGVVVDSRNPVVDIPLVTVERIDVLFDQEVTEAGVPAYKHVTLWKPKITFVLGVAGQDNNIQFDERWIDKLSAVPYRTRTLVVNDGRLDLWDYRDIDPVHVFVTDVELRGEEMAPTLHPIGTRGARLAGSGRVFGKTKASLRMVFEPRSPVPNLDAEMLVEPVPLTLLGPALEVFASVGAERGSMGFSADLSAEGYDVHATIVPNVDDIELRAVGDQVLRKVIVERARRKLERNNIELSYTMKPGKGLFHQFFPELIQAAFTGG